MSLLKTTTSACPHCLEKVPARVVERDGQVYWSEPLRVDNESWSD